MKILISLLSILMLSESCNSAKSNTMSLQEQEQQVLSGTYTVNLLENHDVIPKTLTLTFDTNTNKVSGFAGCNSFFGSYSTNKNTISFGALAITKKYCFDNTINELEDQFMKTLNLAKSFQIQEKTLTLLDNNATTLLKASKEHKLTTSTKSDIIGKNHKDTAITYTAMSRVYFKHISVTPSKITISTDRNLKQMEDYACDIEDWKVIQTLLDGLNRKTFQQLKAPTNKRLVDGAAHATLSVKQDDVSLTTPSFDHGFPPKKIETLVNKVLSLAEKVKKK